MNIRILLLIIFSLLLNGCREINVLTRIDADGSCEKVISIYWENDNAGEHLFPYVIDDSWKMQKKEKAKENKNIYTFTKKFSSLEAYNSEFGKNGYCISAIEKEFRWFFTYYKYKETYKSYNEFNSIPADKFFTADELDRLHKGEDSAWVDEQTKRWQQQNVFEEVFQGLLKGAKRINGSKINTASLQAKKDEIFKLVITNDKGDVDELILLLNKLFHTNEASMLEPELEKVDHDIERKMESMVKAEGDYKNEIILPGIIVKTNANALVGNKAMWTFNADKYLISDYEMYAESRQLNTLVITGSGIVVVLLIGGLSIPFFRKSIRK